MKTIIRVFAFTLIAGLTALLLFSVQPHSKSLRVRAQSRPNPQITASLTSANDGIATYGTSFATARSQTDTANAVAALSNYDQSRSGWSLPAEDASRLANADWAARQSGSAQISAQQIATAVNHLIAVKLAAMSAAQQQALIQQMSVVATPNGPLGLNSYDPNNVTTSQNTNDTITVTVSPAAFSARKILYYQIAPQMVTSGSNFYPAEAEIVIHSIASGDIGYDSTLLANIQKKIGDLTGLDMSSKLLFGDNGYLVRRPLSTFLDQAGLDQLYSDLGF